MTAFGTTGADARLRVKICGITSERDALDAIDAGADALGFNLYRGSKRFIDLKKEEAWVRGLPSSVTKVAVMVNPTAAEAEEVFSLPYIDMVQFHGDEDEEFCARFAGKAMIKAVRMGAPEAVVSKSAASANASMDGAGETLFQRFSTPYILVDAWSAEGFGGTGKVIERALLEQLGRLSGAGHLILSGGLRTSNVKELAELVRPFAVDVASGVESAPGRKDRELVRQFILAARSAKL